MRRGVHAVGIAGAASASAAVGRVGGAGVDVALGEATLATVCQVAAVVGVALGGGAALAHLVLT